MIVKTAAIVCYYLHLKKKTYLQWHISQVAFSWHILTVCQFPCFYHYQVTILSPIFLTDMKKTHISLNFVFND